MQKIGFIGLGIMGLPMARNLLKAGCELTVYDLDATRIEAAAQSGAKAAGSAAQAARGNPAVITMLPNSPHVREAVLGPNGVLGGAEKGTLLIDMSSIAPPAAREIGAECAKKGVEMLDAPVSGGEPGAVSASLSIMVGGNREAFERVRDDILLKMGKSAVYCGELGAGNVTKLANQVIVALGIAACAEAFTLAKKAGVDPTLVFDAIKGGLAGSNVMNAKLPMMLENNFKPGFKIELHSKDLSNALETGHGAGAPLPLTALVTEMLHTLRADGFGAEDHSALARYYEKLSGMAIGGSEGSGIRG